MTPSTREAIERLRHLLETGFLDGHHVIDRNTFAALLDVAEHAVTALAGLPAPHTASEKRLMAALARLAEAAGGAR